MSDRLVTDPKEIADAMRRHEVVNADRVCKVCLRPLSPTTPAHNHRPAESGSFHVRG